MKFLKKYQDHDQNELDFMSPLAAASHSHINFTAQVMLLCIVTFVIAFLIWAGMAKIDDVTNAEGRVIPSSRIQRISHLEGGIIEKIFVKEGSIVEKNQVLLQINSTVAEARVQEGQDFYYRYLAAVERLRAQIEDKPYVTPAIVEDKAPNIAAQEMATYQSRRQKLANDMAIAQSDVKQKQQELLELQNNQKQLTEQCRLANEELKINKPLTDRGLVAKVDLLKLEREFAELQGKLGATEANILRAQATLQQAQEKFNRVPMEYHSEDQKELQEAQNKLANAKGTYTTEGDRLNRTEVRSPVRGIVKELMVSTIGGIVKAGENIVEIVPLEDRLLIEAQVIPADIAFLRPGLKAIVKLTAYDFAVYGGLDAELVEISADTIEDNTKQGKRFFRVLLRTIGTKLSKTSKELPIIPGMTATVAVITGKNTVLNKILKPIVRVQQNALRER